MSITATSSALRSLKDQQPFAVELLNQSIQTNKIAHAYIFKGAKVFTLELVIRFIQTLLCPQQGCMNCHTCLAIESENYPDLHLFRAPPESKTGIVKLAQIKDLIKKTALPPLQSPYQFFVIEGADKMNKESSNALLKTLEEPESQTIIILLTPTTTKILPTILSRAQLIPLYVIQDLSENHGLPLDWKQFNWGKLSLQQQFELSDQLSRSSFDELIQQFQYLQQAYWAEYKTHFYKNAHPSPSERLFKCLTRFDQTIEQLQNRGNIKLILELFFMDFAELNRQKAA